MRDILAGVQSELLARFAWSSTLIGLDFDGTLAPIVPRPDDARMRPATRLALEKLVERYPVAVISGRGLADVRERLDGIPVDAIAGNHGLEPDGDVDRCRATVAAWKPHLIARIGGLQGVVIEDKAFTLAIHYRRSRSRKAALRSIHAAVDSLDGDARVLGGKLVVNVVPPDAPHKGNALIALRRKLGADTAIFVGDDVTDEDVFTLDEPGRLLSVRVCRSASSAAPYYVASQRRVDDLLERLWSLRPNESARRRTHLGR